MAHLVSPLWGHAVSVWSPPQPAGCAACPFGLVAGPAPGEPAVHRVRAPSNPPLFPDNPQPAVKLLYNRSNNKYSYTR